MSCRRICGGAGGARHADARPSTRDLAPPAPRLGRGRKTQPVHKAPGRPVHKFMKRTRGRAPVDLGVARLAASACVLRCSVVVPGRRAFSPFPHASVGCTSAPFETPHGALFAPSMLPMRACSRAACECDSRLVSHDCGAVPILARAARRSLCMWRSAVLFPPLWKLPAHCTCAVPSGARSNNVDH